jgi:hypothetical protein
MQEQRRSGELRSTKRRPKTVYREVQKEYSGTGTESRN